MRRLCRWLIGVCAGAALLGAPAAARADGAMVGKGPVSAARVQPVDFRLDLGFGAPGPFTGYYDAYPYSTYYRPWVTPYYYYPARPYYWGRPYYRPYARPYYRGWEHHRHWRHW